MLGTVSSMPLIGSTEILVVLVDPLVSLNQVIPLYPVFNYKLYSTSSVWCATNGHSGPSAIIGPANIIYGSIRPSGSIRYQ